MSVISVTFHSVESVQKDWNGFLENDLHQIIDNLIDVEKYILSEVQSDMISEGKNTNLLLIFEDEEKRQDFQEIELLNISDIIEKNFGESVMIFTTLLNPQKMKL